MSIQTVECTICKTKNSIDKQINEIVCTGCEHAICPWDTNNQNWSNVLAIDILKREKLKLPYTQHLVRNKIDSENNLPEVSLINTEIGNIYRKNRELKSAIYQIRRSGTLNTDENKSTFVKPCVVDGCRGFLSSQWKCGVCSTWVCPKCHQVKNRKDDDEHVCNEDDVKTAELIQTTTKNCPKCSVGITKIDGCFSGDTLISMWNGTKKLAKNIKVGDELIGSDGSKRTVLDTTSGEDEMYEVIQNKAENYTVNSKHTLVLKLAYAPVVYSSTGKYKCNYFDHQSFSFRSKQFKDEASANEFMETLDHSDTCEIRVDEYMKLPQTTKDRLYGFRTEGVDWDEQEVEIDPYMLGLWLGDGVKNGQDFAANDREIVEELMDWAENNDAEIVHIQKYKYMIRRKGYGYKRGAIGEEVGTCVACKSEGKTGWICDTPREYERPAKKGLARVSPMKELLMKYSLINNKHIPTEYMVNSRENRLKLLAGMIDTDGCVRNDGKRIVIVQVNPVLVEQFTFLARSLGFTTHVTKQERKNFKAFGTIKDYEPVYHINISGEKANEIPTKLPCKKCAGSHPNKNDKKTKISVEHRGRGEYYGFIIDKDHKFAGIDFTSFSNCSQIWCTACHTAFDWRTGKICHGAIHNPHFFEWQRAGGQAPPRNPMDIQCGGLVDRYDIDRVHPAHSNSPYNQYLTKVSELTHHIQHVELDRYPADRVRPEDNEKHRVNYLLKDISEDKWKQLLKNQNKKRLKNHAVNQVLMMYMMTSNDLLRNVLEYSSNGVVDVDVIVKIEDIIRELEKLRIYTNDNLEKIKKRFKNVTPHIYDSYSCYPGRDKVELPITIKNP